MFRSKLLYLAMILTSACSIDVPRSPQTDVSLNKNNYKVLKAAARGESLAKG